MTGYKNTVDSLSDLRSGYVVIFRNGHKSIVARAGKFTKILTPKPNGGRGSEYLSSWDEDFNCKKIYPMPIGRAKEHDIVRVYGLVKGAEFYGEAASTNVSHRSVLWERPEGPKKMTVSEIEKILGYKVEVIEG